MTRCGKLFAGESQWVYWCTCNRKKSELMDSFSCSGNEAYSDVADIMFCCLHIQAIMTVINPLDAVQNISADSDLSGTLISLI